MASRGGEGSGQRPQRLAVPVSPCLHPALPPWPGWATLVRSPTANSGTPWCLQEVAGEPLYMLFRAIQYQVDKGPVDAVTGKAKRTLNDSHLLREDVEFRPLTLMVLVGPGAGVATGGEVQRVPARVLDTDTITQVKEKVLDQIYKGTPFSQRPLVHTLDLGEKPVLPAQLPPSTCRGLGLMGLHWSLQSGARVWQVT